jgi:hypothetical protein
MSQFDIRVSRPAEVDAPPIPMQADDEPPARRLLAHDMEALVWDDNGEGPLPPPD